MRRFIVAALLVLCSVVISVIGFVDQGFCQQVITLNYGNIWPAPHRNSQNIEAWAREVEKRSSGRVKITVYHGATLAPSAQVYDSVMKGIADVGASVFAYTRGRFPLMQVIDLPLSYKSGVVATRLANELYGKFKPKELDDVKVMYLHAHGPALLHTKRPVSKLEDVKGMKIRAQGTVVPIVQALGGAPVGTTMGETYDALRTGVAEGAMAPMEALEGWKWGEVVNYTTESYSIAYSAAMYVVMNKNKWNSLPPDIQRIIESTNDEWIERQGKTWDEIDASGKAFLLKRGNKIIVLSKEESERWAKAVRPLLDEYVTNAKAKGLPGEEALKFCLDYLKTH
jgi:TRAP-type C4-dicarboxylate transport system substrate-binding protein